MNNADCIMYEPGLACLGSFRSNRCVALKKFNLRRLKRLRPRCQRWKTVGVCKVPEKISLILVYFYTGLNL